MKPNNHGGKRPNSGRPKSDKKKHLISVLPKHIEAIRAFIKSLHETQP